MADLIINQGYPCHITRYAIHTAASRDILSSVPGTSPMFTVAPGHGLTMGDHVFVSQVGDGAALFGGAIVNAALNTTVSVSMLSGEMTTASGTGLIAKVHNVTGYLLVLKVFSRALNDPSPTGMQGAIDLGSTNILIRNVRPGDVRVGDALTLPYSGIFGAAVLSTEVGEDSPGAVFILAAVDQKAAKGTGGAWAPMTRQGRLLAQSVGDPVGDPLDGVLRVTLLPSQTVDLSGEEMPLVKGEKGGCRDAEGKPCSPMRDVGCYELTLARGVRGPAGYRAVYGDQTILIESGRALLAIGLGV